MTQSLLRGDSMLQFVINPAIGYGEDIIRYIESRAFLDHPPGREVSLSNRRNRLFLLNLASVPRALMLKRNRVDPGISWHRRLLVTISSKLVNRAMTAYQGALALNAAGIPSMQAVAWWSVDDTTAGRVDFFCYEQVIASFSVHEYRKSISDQPREDQQRAFDYLVCRVARLARDLHEAGFRHGAFELGNVLVRLKNDLSGFESEPEASVEDLVLIDTDRVRRTRTRWSLLKKLMDLRDLSRIRFDRRGRTVLLQHYLGKRPGSMAKLCLQFWFLSRISIGKLVAGRPHVDPELIQPGVYCGTRQNPA